MKNGDIPSFIIKVKPPNFILTLNIAAFIKRKVCTGWDFFEFDWSKEVSFPRKSTYQLILVGK